LKNIGGCYDSGDVLPCDYILPSLLPSLIDLSFELFCEKAVSLLIAKTVLLKDRVVNSIDFYLCAIGLMLSFENKSLVC